MSEISLEEVCPSCPWSLACPVGQGGPGNFHVWLLCCPECGVRELRAVRDGTVYSPKAWRSWSQVKNDFSHRGKINSDSFPRAMRWEDSADGYWCMVTCKVNSEIDEETLSRFRRREIRIRCSQCILRGAVDRIGVLDG